MTDLPLDQVYDTPSGLPPHFFSVLASQMLVALSGATAAPIKAIDDKLQFVIRSILAGADRDAVNAVLQGRGARAVLDAYVLGQINFAEKLAASAAESRIEDPALQMLREPRFAPYITELLRGERTNTELAQHLKQAEETVSRNIGQLRREGITDFRKYGRSVYNFLTPVSLQILAAEKAKAEEFSEPDIEKGVQGLLKQIRENQPPYMRDQLTFGMVGGP